MLTNHVDILKSDYELQQRTLQALEEDETINKKGFIYQERRDQLLRKLRGILFKIKNLGCNIPIVTAECSIYDKNILSTVTIQFSGISEKDAISILKLRYPTSFDHRAKTRTTGKPKIKPILNKSEFTGKTGK